MLTMNTRRYNGMWHDFPELTKPLGTTYVHIVRYELGFGAQVISAAPDRLELKTSFFGNYDLVTITGPAEEMVYVLTVAAIYTNGRGTQLDDLLPLLEPLRRSDGGFRPFDVAHFGEILMGMALAPAAALMGIGIEATEEIAKHGIDEIMAAIEMALNDGDIDEARELLAA